MNQREGFMDSKKNPPEKKNSLKIMEINPWKKRKMYKILKDEKSEPYHSNANFSFG